jgi:hypothetical protein
MVYGYLSLLSFSLIFVGSVPVNFMQLSRVDKPKEREYTTQSGSSSSFLLVQDFEDLDAAKEAASQASPAGSQPVLFHLTCKAMVSALYTLQSCGWTRNSKSHKANRVQIMSQCRDLLWT